MGFGCAPEAGVCVAGEQECADVEAEFCTCDGQTSIDRTCPLSRYAYRGACAPSELQAAQVVYDSGGNLQEGPAPTLEVGACGSGKPAEVVAAQLSNQGINARFAAMPREGGSQYLFLARSSENCEIVKVDKTRCSTEIFDSLPSGPNGCRIELAASASHVFWTYGDDPDPKQPQLFRRPIAGGETEQIPVGSGTRLLAADSTHAYGLTFVPGSAFELVRIASRTESVVGRVLDFGPPFVNISVAESEAIIGAWNPVLDAVMLGALVRIDLSTNTLQLLAKQDRLVGSSAALFGDYVYYCSSVGVMRLAKNGGPHTRIISGAMSAVADCSLKVDATGLYFNANNEPALVHANLDGGNPKRIAPPNAHGKFAIDDTHIYWLSPEGDLLRMLKPKG